MSELTIAFIGYGEAGGLLAHGLAQRGLNVRAYDLLFDTTEVDSESAHERREAMFEKAAAAKVTTCKNLAEAIKGAHVVVSAVTASSAAQAAGDAGRLMTTGQVFLDINSVSPETKRGDCVLVEANGADYVEAAVMAPVPPYGIKVPMLLGGKRAEEVAVLLSGLGMKAKAVSQDVGVASAIKMCRSVMIKGIEALTVESMAAARHYGCEAAVLASLEETFPGIGWSSKLPHYLISRVAEHGERRAAEMREVAQTLRDAGVPPYMSEASVQVQDAIPQAMRERGMRYDTEKPFEWPAFIDQLAAKS
jgi:3-hydroxyisobutyrate dehydrogenase-like beta-hydroxyacid dehydrogenase